MSLAKRVAARYLHILAAQDQEQLQQDQVQDQNQQDDEEGVEKAFGGVGPFFLPDEHVAGMRVPKGGSCCANCKFGSTGEDDTSRCVEPNFVAWNGGDELPAPADEYCSDWWQPAE